MSLILRYDLDFSHLSEVLQEPHLLAVETITISTHQDGIPKDTHLRFPR
jgi:hypothetical protein